MSAVSKPPVALIAGPTASGKSALALALAEGAGGIVINADSAQLYSGLETLSAAPSQADRDRAEHRLYGISDGTRPFSAADWAVLARQEIDRAQGQGKLPILVGGTGLYLRTLLDGIAPVPPIDPDVRAEVRAADVASNRGRLLKLDPEAADRLKPADSARIARALEVVLSTGRTLAEWQSHREGGIGGSVALRPLILLPPRPWLYARCDRRFEEMMDDGAVAEVAALLERGLDPDLPVMRAIGVREIADWLSGRASKEEAVAAGRQATRRYAKRQYTWFAHQPPAGWPRFPDPLDGSTMASALALLAPKD